MSRQGIIRSIAFVLVLAFSSTSALAATSCPPPPFDRTVEYQGSATWNLDGENCHLTTSLAAGKGSAVATAAFQLPASAAPLRLGFRLDRS